MSKVYDANEYYKVQEVAYKKDENGNKTNQIYIAVTNDGTSLWTAKKVPGWYASNGQTDYKWSIWGKLSARPDKLLDIPIPVASIFVDWDGTGLYVMTDTGWKPFE